MTVPADFPFQLPYIKRAARPVRAFRIEAAMTGSTLSSEGLDERRRKLLFRSWHRGTREMDFMMGRFADAWLGRLGDADLSEFERLIDVPDPELYDWIAGMAPPRASYDTDLLRRMRAFHAGTAGR
jgi:antitoxin CptB